MEELSDDVELTSLFNKISGGTKTVNFENATKIIYKLGFAPSKEDLEMFFKVTNGVCNLSNLKKFCNKIKSLNYSTENLINLFLFHDPQKTGKISKNKFKTLYTTVGLTLSSKEIDIIIHELCDDKELIDYKEFLNKLLNKEYN